MKIDNLNDDEKFALKVLKISAVVLVFLSALMIALSVCASPISPSASARGEAPCYCTSQEVTDCQPSGETKKLFWHTVQALTPTEGVRLAYHRLFNEPANVAPEAGAFS